MSQTSMDRLLVRLGDVDELNRELSVRHLTFATGRITQLKQQIFAMSGQQPLDLSRRWSSAEEIALLDALVLFGAPEEQLQGLNTLWNFWGRVLSAQLVRHRVPNISQIFGEVADMLDVFEVIRNRIMVMADSSDADKTDFIDMLSVTTR